jgi:hypothetical protein
MAHFLWNMSEIPMQRSCLYIRVIQSVRCGSCLRKIASRQPLMVATSSGEKNMKQMNVVVYIMYIIYVMWMVAFLAVVSSKPTVEIGTDVVAEILRAIGGREDMQRVGRYLSASRDHLVKELPLLTSGIKKYTSYGIYYSCYCNLQRKSSRALFCCE